MTSRCASFVLRGLPIVAYALALLACGADAGPGPVRDGSRGTDASGPDGLDGGGPNDDAHGPTDVSALDAMQSMPDVMLVDGTGAYDIVSPGDVVTGCDAGTCSPHADMCATAEVCDDGLDNNCNGTVDEGCPCLPGAVQRCFQGPPGRRGVGACSDGQQTCQGDGEFGTWGPCAGGIVPTGETCDHLDNDCNGCADERLCCSATGSCPGPGDPRIPTGHPFGTVTVDGTAFLPGATMYRWHVVGGPCDQLLWATSNHVSYRLNAGMTNSEDATGPMLTFAPTLSGDYTVTLTMTRPDGTTLVCTFIVPVRANGFRAELCWNTTGTDDLDLWVHKPASTSNWPADATTPDNVCYYANCRNDNPPPSWGYANTAGGACREPATGGVCHNPRLDIDNIDQPGEPENINVDTPHDGDKFRIAANYYGAGASNHTVHPMVNIYCGGQLRATYGGADATGMHFGSTNVTGFNHAGEDGSGSVWRVADVTLHEPAGTCTIAPLHVTGTHAGYCVATNSTRTYAANCAP